MSKHGREAARIFVHAFIGSVLTLWAGGKYLVVNTEGIPVPDWSLIDEMLISAAIAGVISLLMWVESLLANGNGDTIDTKEKA